MLVELIGNYEEFVGKVVSKSLDLGLNLHGYEIDHICYRCDSKREYLRMRLELSLAECNHLHEGMIGDRPISVFEFNPPLQCGEWTVRCLELASPKAGRAHFHGLEHAEVVIGTAATAQGCLNSKPLLEEFVSRCPPGLVFDFKAADKEVNADVSLDLGDNVSLKFHVRPLYEVCMFEMEQGRVESVPDDYYDEDEESCE